MISKKDSELRPYQVECLQVIEETFKETDSQLVQLPTGGGKTRIFLEYIKRHCESALIVVPTNDLKEQVTRNAKEMLGASSVWASDGENGRSYRGQKFIVTTASTLNFKFRDKLFEMVFDLIVIDEAHHAQCATYMNFLKDYDANQGSWKLLGVTATPERADKKSLLELFVVLSFDRSIFDMIKDGYLCDVKAYRHDTEETISSHDVANGDFTLKALRKLDNDTRNNLILKVIRDHCHDRKTLVFCIDVEHTETMAKKLMEHGYNACAIHGRMDIKTRQHILSDFRTGKIQILTNCQLLTEGFDEPSIESIVIARPTRSKSLYCQMVGRGTRLHPGKTHCEMHELTDNAFKICSFDVCCDIEPENCRSYRPGILLSERNMELQHFDVQNVKLTPKAIDLFKPMDSLKQLPPFPHQIEWLKKGGYPIYDDMTYLEIAFLIWEAKIMKIYNLTENANGTH